MGLNKTTGHLEFGIKIFVYGFAGRHTISRLENYGRASISMD